jgi:hypothetical protein
MSGTWRNRIVGSGEEAPDQLLANPANWRTHPGPQRDAIRGSLNEVGWVQQVMVNRRTGFVVDGHARIEEALTRHEPTVPVLYVDLSEEEERLVLAVLDPIGAMATRDDARLKELLADLSPEDGGLQALLDSLGHDGYSFEDRLKEWGGMPGMEMDDATGWGVVHVHFRSEEDAKDFEALVGQKMRRGARVWYPESERHKERGVAEFADA